MTINITYVAQVGLPRLDWRYMWSGRVLTATLVQVDEDADGNPVETVLSSEDFDFSLLAAGDEAEEITPDVLQYNPVISAACDNAGDLHVQLLHWYDGGDEPQLEPEVLNG